MPPPAPEPTTTTSAGEDCWVGRIFRDLSVAQCTAGVAWVSDTDPPLGGSLYGGHRPLSAAQLDRVPHRAQRRRGLVAQPSALVAGDVGKRLVVHPRRSEEHTSELQSRRDLVCRLLLEKKKK